MTEIRPLLSVGDIQNPILGSLNSQKSFYFELYVFKNTYIFLQKCKGVDKKLLHIINKFPIFAIPNVESPIAIVP